MMFAKSDEGTYRCVVSNAANSVTSAPASLTVCMSYSFHAGFICILPILGQVERAWCYSISTASGSERVTAVASAY